MKSMFGRLKLKKDNRSGTGEPRAYWKNNATSIEVKVRSTEVSTEVSIEVEIRSAKARWELNWRKESLLECRAMSIEVDIRSTENYKNLNQSQQTKRIARWKVSATSTEVKVRSTKMLTEIWKLWSCTSKSRSNDWDQIEQDHSK